LEEIKGKIDVYREAIDQHKIKVTLKDTDVNPIPAGFTLHAKKTLLHKDISSASTTGKKGSKDEGAAVAINCVTFN
jgi:WD40 repeat protein